MTDAEGHTTTYEYNADGTVALVVDPRGNPLALPDYDANGLPGRIVDAAGGVTRLGHDVDGRLRWIQEPIHTGIGGGDPGTTARSSTTTRSGGWGRAPRSPTSIGDRTALSSGDAVDPTPVSCSEQSTRYGRCPESSE